MRTLGEELVAALQARGVDTVFGIPGVHTIELYRGLAAGGLRHVTPRHEQGAGFMADGYARVSGKPGVAFVITGPGLTNALTPLAQARADSVPVLTVSGVNRQETLGRDLGCLHELPDQLAMMRTLTANARRLGRAEDLGDVIADTFETLRSAPGPAHIEVPMDAMALPCAPAPPFADHSAEADPQCVRRICARLAAARRPVILAGGGARHLAAPLRALAERLDAPVVQTANARGTMHGHRLGVPASPSLPSVRSLLAEADLVLALGTELGPTDYDMYALGGLPGMPGLIHVDLNPAHLARGGAELAVTADLTALLPALAAAAPRLSTDGSERAQATRLAARAELDRMGPGYGTLLAQLEALRSAFPNAVMAGDSTQAIYAGNLYYDHDRPGGWFNGSTGFGALGYAIPAAIGAALAAPGTPVLALVGDGGAQFTLPEIAVAREHDLPILFVIWNNAAYGEIARAMEDAGFPATGCHPTPPDFAAIAAAYGLPHHAATAESLATTLAAMPPLDGPALLEIALPR